MYFQFACLALLAVTASAVEFQISNKSPTQQTFIQILGTTATDPFILAANEERTINFPEPWSGRIWARNDCTSPQDCSPIPATLVEMTVDKNFSFYDISLVDGFNVMATIVPVGGTPEGDPYDCVTADCNYEILDDCPDELRLKNDQGVTVSCQAACNVFNDDLYCCRGEHGTPETCKSSDWPIDYAGWFKQRCPHAYSYAYDDQKSTYTCDTETYLVTFN